MKYIDIQLTDKELWKQFQAKYQAGEYADALALMQKPNQNSGAYVWEKYDAIAAYSEKKGTIEDGFEEKPSDLDNSAKYIRYSFDSATGIFTLSLTDPSGKYYATNSPQKIYHYSSYLITGGGTEQRKNLYVPYTAVPDGYQKGSTYYGTVTSEDEAAYPANGEQDGYWYVLVDEPTGDSYKGLTAKALNTLTDYIVWVENLNDSSFKADKPPVQANQPTQTTGELWFQVTN